MDIFLCMKFEGQTEQEKNNFIKTMNNNMRSSCYYFWISDYFSILPIYRLPFSYTLHIIDIRMEKLLNWK